LFDVLAKLDAMFSNVAPKEDLLQQFFNSAQQVCASGADYACRIEPLFQMLIDKSDIPVEARNYLLRHRL